MTTTPAEEFDVQYVPIEGALEVEVVVETLRGAQVLAEAMSRKHGSATASRYRKNADDDYDLPSRSLLCEWVYANGALDFVNEVEAA